MEHKAWLWRRKSSENTAATNGKPDLPFAGNEHENGKALELVRSFEDLKEQLCSALTDSNAKDDLLAKRVKVAEEAIAGWEKAQTEAESLKKELTDALLQKAASEERVFNKDAALKECIQKLCVVEEEHQYERNDAATTISRAQEEARVLEKKLAETNNSLAKLGIENSNLTRILEVKEKLIEDLNESKSQSEANFTTLVERLDSSDKDNASLKYEVSMLQKELEVRNQDRDFHLKSAGAAHKQYLESLKKISKLESECQRLRVMVRQRLPGPSSIAKMKSEVQILDNNTVDRMRKKPILALDAMISRDFMPGSDCDSFSKRVASLIERLHAVEVENKILKEALVKKNNELQSSRIMLARTASKLSQAEKQLYEFSKERIFLELARNEDGGNEDAISCSESWASALISELEHFKNGKATTPSITTAGVSELSLMDDFIEMEKIAIVCVEKQSESNINSGERITSLVPRGIDSEVISSESAGKEMVPANPSGVLSDSSIISQEIKHTVSSSLGASMVQNETNKQPFLSDLEKPVCKMIELFEGIIQRSFTNNIGEQRLSRKDESTPRHKSVSPNRHVGHVFLGEIPEACNLLQHFIVVCNDLLHGKADFKKFAYELAATLEWIINHCFSVQDLSTVEEKIKKLFSGDVSQESRAGIFCRSTETNKVMEPEEFKSRTGDSLSLSTLLNGQYTSENEEVESKLKDENRRLRSQIGDRESRKTDLEERLETASTKNGSLSTQLKESDERISNLQAELVTLKYSNSLIEDQIENQNLITEDLGTQLMVANVELKQAPQKFSSLEVELEDKSSNCEELEATCLELQLQLESVATVETPKYGKVEEEKQLRTDWDISAASEKLAECQATILSLGKQLKALAAPKDTALFDKVMSSPSVTNINRQPQLLGHMQAENEATSEHLKSPKTKEIIRTEIKHPPASTTSGNNPIDTSLNQPSPVKSSGSTFSLSDDFNRQKGETHSGRLVLVQKRQKGGASFLKNLLSRMKKESKKKALPIGS